MVNQFRSSFSSEIEHSTMRIRSNAETCNPQEFPARSLLMIAKVATSVTRPQDVPM
jgi:hypothetical protein